VTERATAEARELEIRADEEAAMEILAMLTLEGVERPADPWPAPPEPVGKP
jgi:hypothetical protein